MFRTQQNAFDDAVAKATDENLTSENWEFILDACDKVNSADSGPKDVVAAMIKRLAHRNANVQLYTLELANALSQNCGEKMWRELASRGWTEGLSRLASERTTHPQVKMKIAERMDEWTKMFKGNPDLGIMEQAYGRLKSSNPNIQPPQAPQKQRITDYDRQREEEELQMALKLSIQDSSSAAGPSGGAKPTAAELSGKPATSANSQAASQPIPTGTTAATVSRVRALFDFQPSEPGELQFRKNDVIAVLESVYKDWWKGSLRGQTGIFPLNYVEKLQDPTQEELQNEAKMEAEVFGQIKNVEKLLALLSTTAGDMSARDNEEITELYHGTLAIRPKLIELIGKYTQKKDDFQQLNEKFIKARRDYETLLETSMAQSAQQYARPNQQPYGYVGIPPPQPGYPPQQPQRFYTADGQPPNSGLPYPPPNQSTASFQPPYPISSPPPQSQTPSNQPPHASNMDPYAQYPPQTQPHQQPITQRRQSHHSEYQPQEMGTSVYDTPSDTHPPRHSYPPLNIAPSQPPPPEPTNYSASIYSQESHNQSQPQFGQPSEHQPPSQSYAQPPYGFPPQDPGHAPPPPQTQYQAPPTGAPPPIPQGMVPDRQESVTPLPQSSAYPQFGAGPGQGGYQAYQPQPQQAGGYYR